jgi:hypothetical protein
MATAEPFRQGNSFAISQKAPQATTSAKENEMKRLATTVLPVELIALALVGLMTVGVRMFSGGPPYVFTI